MSRLIMALLIALLVGCGSKSGDVSKERRDDPSPPAEGDFSGLDGLPLEEFIRAIVPRLAKEPGIQNPAELAKALDQKWKIHCEQICRIERK